MEILIGLVVAAALLYFWLVAHWFARLLVFLLLGAGLLTIGALIAEPPANILFAVFGVVAAWYVAGIPTYYWRHQHRRFMQAAGFPVPQPRRYAWTDGFFR